MKYPRIADTIAKWLLVIGGLNFGLDAIGFNLVQRIEDFAKTDWLAETAYILVGISAIRVGYLLWTNKKKQ